MRSIGSLSSVHRLLLVSFGVAAVACGTDPVPNLPKFPVIPTFDGGTEDDGGGGDGDETVTCSGGDEVGATDTRTRYQAATVPAGETCVSEEQTRTCLESGTWSDWSGEYENSDCTPETVDGSCEDGATETRTRWNLVETDAGDIECVSEEQTHTCEAGAWGTWSGSYVLETCKIAYDDCDDQPHGTEETRTRYAAAMADPGQECQEEMQTRECDDGLWTDWTGTFTEEACVPSDGKCGGKDNGSTETRTMYEAELAEAGEACVSEEQTRTCTDGVWSDWVGAGDEPFTAAFCDLAGQQRCDRPGGGEAIPHGATYTYVRYASATVPYGETCTEDTEEVTCDNGVLPPYTGEATHTTCTVGAPAGCVDGDVTHVHGYERTRTRYQATRVAVDESCMTETQVSKCDNGTWTEFDGPNDYMETECMHHCDGGEHGSTQRRIRYTAPSVGSGSSCDDVEQEQTRTCTDGVWGPGTTLPGGWTGDATEESCRVRKRDCRNPGGGAPIQDGESLTRERYKDAFPAGACELEIQERLCSDGTLADWTPNTFTMLGCGADAPEKDKTASCRWIESNTPRCIEWSGTILVGPQVYCLGMPNSTFDDERGCPTENAYAVCESSGDPKFEYYYVDVASSVCSGGTFTVLKE